MRIRRKAGRLNVLLAGASGVGKTAFVATMAGCTPIPDSIGGEDRFFSYTLEDQEKSIVFVDTKGSGHELEYTDGFSEIENLISERYKRYLLEESKVCRDPDFDDERIHLVIYFLSPCSRGVKDFDLALLKLLHSKVNIVPVLPKADCYTAEEMSAIKERARKILEDSKIELFDVSEESGAALLPLSLLTTEVPPAGKTLQKRVYKTGSAVPDNPEHCDFLAIKRVLSDAWVDLVNSTHNYFYENYRKSILKR